MSFSLLCLHSIKQNKPGYTLCVNLPKDSKYIQNHKANFNISLPSNPKLQHQVRCASPLPEAKNEEEKIDVSCSEQFKRTTKTPDVCVPSSETKNKIEENRADVSCSERSKTSLKNVYVRPFVQYQNRMKKKLMCLFALNVPNCILRSICASLCPVSKQDEEQADVFAPSAPKHNVSKYTCVPSSEIKKKTPTGYVFALSNPISYSRILMCVPSNLNKKGEEDEGCACV